jgi:hypothetical protein
LIARLTPKDVDHRLSAFLDTGCRSDPTFDYECDTKSAMLKLRSSHSSYLPYALSIIQRGSPTVTGMHVSHERLRERFMGYLRDFHMQDLVDVELVDGIVSPASVLRCNSGLRHNPVSHRILVRRGNIDEGLVDGIVAHEVGTHLLRMTNDEHQVWSRGDRNRHALLPHQSTEEGLASLNGLVVTPRSTDGSNRLLFSAALRYWAVVEASRCSFVQLFELLAPYVLDLAERFRFCCRIKRGLVDTSQPGACTIDQYYFIGAVDLLLNLGDIDFPLLYCGLIHWRDLPRIKNIVRKSVIILPPFLRGGGTLERYIRDLRSIARDNCIPVAEVLYKQVPEKRARTQSIARRSHMSR